MSVLAVIEYTGRDFCVEALEEALVQYGAPEIVNTDHSIPSSPAK